jgi:hypothetical protein
MEPVPEDQLLGSFADLRKGIISFKKFQRDDSFYSTLLFPDSSTTTAGHTPFVNPDAVNTV